MVGQGRQRFVSQWPSTPMGRITQRQRGGGVEPRRRHVVPVDLVRVELRRVDPFEQGQLVRGAVVPAPGRPFFGQHKQHAGMVWFEVISGL